MAEPERILIVRPSALGDVCRTVPVLVSLRRRYPAARIDWIVRDVLVDAVRAHPALDEVVPFPRDEFTRLMRRGRFRPVLAWLNNLRRRRYDLVLDAQGLARSGIFAWVTRAQRRIGYARAPELAWLAYTIRVRAPASAHTVDRMLELARAGGAEPVTDLALHAPPEDRDVVEREFGPAFAPIVLAPTSAWPGKRWPIERFATLAERLLETGGDGSTVALVGAPHEREQCRPLLELAERRARVLDLIGRTSIGRLMALIERARLVVANDSAALHMAAGFGRPLIALFGPTDIARVGPYGREGDAMQRLEPDDPLPHDRPRLYRNESVGRALMERITVDEVFEAALSRLREPPGSESPAAPGLTRSSTRSPS